jgi:hypothetical protein
MSFTRAQLGVAIDQAHECIHAGKVDAAHEVLHSVGSGASERIECATADPEAQSLMAEFMEKLKNPIPCGHTFGDLIFAPGSVTKCGACLLAKKQAADSASDLFYIQDTRPPYIGDCILWWRPDACGYTTDLEEAGLYTADYCKGLRDTDKPWPQQLIEKAATRHVRADSLSRVLGQVTT